MNEEIGLERIRKCRVGLEYSNPFFAYLLLHLKPKKFNKELEETLKKSGQKPTMCVDMNSNLYYSDEFVKELDDDLLTSVLLHELGHLFLSHHFRLKRQFKECPEICNIACDLAVNQIIKENGFKLPDGCFISDENDEFDLNKLFGVKNAKKKV